MPKAKKEPANPQVGVAIPEMVKRREVVYSIIVPNCAGRVAIDKAKRELHARAVPNHLIQQIGDTIQVPRLPTLWQGDAEEKAWQKSIQDALPGTLIDVQDWTHAAGYPMGDLTL